MVSGIVNVALTIIPVAVPDATRVVPNVALNDPSVVEMFAIRVTFVPIGPEVGVTEAIAVCAIAR